jgi:alanyl-tRNA synthetase
MIKDGISPSNEGRGYVLRRLIRRMYYNMMLLKEVDVKTLPTFLKNIIKEIVSLFDLTGNFDPIVVLLEKEVTQFQKTISNGQKLLQDIITSAKKKMISGADTFKLYDTFGFPVELTKEIAMEAKFTVDEQ